jgi:ribonuclease J
MNDDEKGDLVFVPLGGAGEIGMNLNLYGYGTKDVQFWVMVDLGVTFNDGTHPGVDIIMPDPTFIEERSDDLLALVLTHAHEDHLGAVPHLWRRLRCPIYATPFTASLLRSKLIEANLIDEVEVIIVPLQGRFQVGPFNFELITLTHSIPEPNALAIRTPVGTIRTPLLAIAPMKMLCAHSVMKECGRSFAIQQTCSIPVKRALNPIYWKI